MNLPNGPTRNATWALCAALLLQVPAVTQAQYQCATNAGTITILGYNGPGGALVIPAKINGLTVASIGDGAFLDNDSLASVTIPGGVTFLGASAFESCSALGSVTILGKIPGIRDSTFSNCGELTNVVMPSSVQSISDFAFYSCEKLDGVTLPANLASLGRFAFSYCTNLTAITFPRSVTGVDSSAFDGCTRLAKIKVDPANAAFASLNGVLFDKYLHTLILYPCAKPGPYAAPASVTKIEEKAFRECSELTALTLPEGVTSIEDEAFRYCGKLAAVQLPGSLHRIGSFAFADCDSLAAITIPAGVNTIGMYAFYQDSALASITVSDTNAYYSSVDGVLFTKGLESLIRFPEAKSGGFSIPEATTAIESAAFERCFGLTDISIPAGIAEISGFSECKGLTNVTLATGPTVIAPQAFIGCTALAEIAIPSSVVDISPIAFSGCHRLTAISVSDTNAVYSSLDGILFDKDQGALLLVPEGTTDSYTIPASVTNISGTAFSGCTGLTDLAVAGLNPAYSSSNGVVFGKSKTAIIRCPPGRKGAYEIPFGVTRIGYGAFGDCAWLTDVTIPSGVTTIEGEAFSYCGRLSRLFFPASLASLGDYVFDECDGLDTLYFRGNAPSLNGEYGQLGLFGATVCYLPVKTGWSNPWAEMTAIPWKGGRLCFSYDRYSPGEGTTVKVWVKRINGTKGAASVAYTTVPATALAGKDYTPKSGTLTWANEQDAPQAIKVSILADGKSEGAESFQLVLSNPSGASLMTPSRKTITIPANTK